MEFYLLTDIHSRFLVANPTPTPGGVSRLLVGGCRSSSLRFCTQGRGTGLITWPHRIPGPTSRDLPAQISSPLPEAPFLLILLPAPAELQGRPEALREERQPDPPWLHWPTGLHCYGPPSGQQPPWFPTWEGSAACWPEPTGRSLPSPRPTLLQETCCALG